MRGFFICSLLALFSFTVAIPTCSQGPYAPVEGDCSKFKQCVWGTYTVMPCPANLAWSQELYRCDWPTDNCLANAPECSDGEFEPVEGDCTRYKVCNHGAYTTMTCGLGTVWHQDESTCDWPRAVDSCVDDDQGIPDDECGTEDKMIPWANCRGFDWCLNGNRKMMGKNGKCAVGTRFSRSLQVCVWKGDRDDDCDPTTDEESDDEEAPDNTPGNAPEMSIEEYCEYNDGKVLPHPSECQLYINCSDAYPEYLGYMRLPYIRECTYPQLFNEKIGECDDFQNVECGERREEKYKFICNYYAYQCGRAHCRPCSADAADCRGRPDGINAHSARPDSPYYVTCKDGRWVPQEFFECPRGDGYRQLFDKETNTCYDPRA